MLSTTIPHNVLLKVLSESITFIFTLNRIFYNIYIGHPKVVRKDISLKKLWSVSSHTLEENTTLQLKTMSLNKMLVFLWRLTQHHSGKTYFVIFQILTMSNNLTPLGSPKAYRYYGTSKFIEDLCAVNNNAEFLSCFRKIYPKKLELKVEHQRNHQTFLDLDITIQNGVFVYKRFDKEINFHFLLLEYLTYQVIFYHLWFNIFRVS